MPDCDLFTACLFLWFCYRPSDLSTANLHAAQDHLPALLRLAHKLDAENVLRAIINRTGVSSHWLRG